MVKKTRPSQKDEAIQISGVNFTHPDKKFTPTKTVTKLALANYYDRVSEWILPHIVNRPLTLLRSPSSSKGVFYQKHYFDSFPSSINRLPISGQKSKEDYLMIKDKQGLLSLIQFDVLEIHPWGSKASNLDKPDRIIFDLDPDDNVDWKTVIEGAILLNNELKKLGLKSFVKTSGGKGLHVVIPIKPIRNWSEIKQFTQAIALMLAQKYPDRFTATVVKAKRQGKIFLDYLRNIKGATAAAAYSTRARPDAPISVPLTWKELSKTKSGAEFTITNMNKRLSKLKKDPWEGFFQCRQGIPASIISKLV